MESSTGPVSYDHGTALGATSVALFHLAKIWYSRANMLEGIAVKKEWEPIDFKVYFVFIRWIALVAIVLEVIFRVWAANLVAGPIAERQEALAWAWRAVIFGFLAWRVIKSFGFSPMVGTVAGGLAGFSLGLVVALTRFVDGFKIWKLFNIISETALTAIGGALVVSASIILMSWLARFRRR